MQGEAARGWNLDPKHAPTPPVTTRRVHSDAPDPGAASRPLPPFRPRTVDAPHADIAEGFEPTAEVAPEPIEDIELEPIADLLRDAETQSEPDPSAVAYEAGHRDQPERAANAEIEEAWLLDEIVDADDANTDLASGESWPPSDAGESATIREASADISAEAAETREPEADEEPWDALGAALQEAVARAAPPLAEDRVRSGSESHGPPVINEPPEMAPAPDRSPQAEVGIEDAEVTGALDQSGTAKPSADGLTEGFAATLESLAESLRARGFNALDDAFARGDRLESSLALFLAGYRAGRGE